MNSVIVIDGPGRAAFAFIWAALRLFRSLGLKCSPTMRITVRDGAMEGAVTASIAVLNVVEAGRLYDLSGLWDRRGHEPQIVAFIYSPADRRGRARLNLAA